MKKPGLKLKPLFHSRQFRYGAVSTAISIVFIALIVAVNAVASALSDRFPLTVDLTPNNAFKLSSESMEFVKGLQKPVQITVLASETELASTNNVYLSQVKSVIDQYAQHNTNITVSYVDMVKDPTFVNNYPDLELAYYDVLIASGNRTKTLSIYDMFNVSTNQQTGQQSIRSSRADELMTSALMGVVSDEVTQAGILTGHNEADSSALRGLLEKNNYEVVDVSLTGEEAISPAVDVLFLLAPTRDPDPQLLKKLDTFLENGRQYGKTLFYAANAEQPPTPNLDAFLSDWGIRVNDGAVFETNTANVLSYTSPYYCSVEYTADEYVQKVANPIRVAMPYGRPLEKLFDAQSGYQTTELLSYSPSACVFPADAPEGWQPTPDMLGAVPALIRSSFMRYEGTTPLQSNVFVASAAMAFDSTPLGSRSVNNADYFMSLLNTVTDRKDLITIAPKDLGGQELGVSVSQAMVISIIMIFAVPLAIVAIGIVVWMRRRHK